MILFCFFEHFPYRQLHMLWGTWKNLRGDVGWKQFERVGFQGRSEPKQGIAKPASGS